MDPVAVTALILSVIGGLGHFIKDIDLYHIGCCCVNSDCNKNIVDKKINHLTEKISKHNITIEKLKISKNSNSKLEPDSPISASSA